MKLSNILNSIIGKIAVKFDIPERVVLRILVSHTKHIKSALAEPEPVEIKLDYFGKFLPKDKSWEIKRKNDESNNAGERASCIQPRS